MFEVRLAHGICKVYTSGRLTVTAWVGGVKPFDRAWRWNEDFQRVEHRPMFVAPHDDGPSVRWREADIEIQEAYKAWLAKSVIA